MPVSGRDPTWSAIPLRDHIANAANLTREQLEDVAALADDLRDRSVLPVLGAGASCDCGVKLAGALAEGLFDQVLDRDPAVTAAVHELRCPVRRAFVRSDLGRTADLIAMFHDPELVIDELGLDNDASWPVAGRVPDHFCGYRVLARLAREGLFREAVTFNYDCYFEAGMDAEGWSAASTRMHGIRWPQRRSVIVDQKTHRSLQRPGDLSLFKVHGCVEGYRRDPKVDRIVIRWTQLLDWRGDRWAHDLMADRTRRHVLLLIGFGGEDPVIHASLQRIMEEVEAGADCPRIRVIDPFPDKLALSLLVARGCGASIPSPGPGVRIRSDATPGGLTAVLLALLDEWIWRRVSRRHGGAVPSMARATRVALTTATAPVSMRWSYSLDPSLAHLAEEVAEEQVGGRSYVPLSAFPVAAARIARVWARLVAVRTDESFGGDIDHGFLLDEKGPVARLPVGISEKRLEAVDESEVRNLAARFGVPAYLGPMLVAEKENGEGLVGRVVGTGVTVEL